MQIRPRLTVSSRNRTQRRINLKRMMFTSGRMFSWYQFEVQTQVHLLKQSAALLLGLPVTRRALKGEAAETG